MNPPSIPASGYAPLRLALLGATLSAGLLLGACLFGGGPLVIAVEPGGARIDGRRFEDAELDRELERAFHDGGVREVILEAGEDSSADYLASLMDRIHAASAAAGLAGDCKIEARARPAAPQLAPAEPR